MNDPDETAEPLAPVIPDMEMLRRIGKGGFGEVWLARNRIVPGLRAVKIIALSSTGSVDRAGREIVSLNCLEQNAGVKHANLLTIHHVGKTPDYLFYIMDPADDVSGERASDRPEYVPATLATRLGPGPLAGAECVRCSRQLLAALACLHQQDLVHRDVKPANCLFIGGDLKLADFGLLTDADRAVSCVGTMRYMPPDGTMDQRADVYAAGLVIYEMITGLPVERFPALGPSAKAIRKDRRLTALNRLCLRACDPDRNARFPSAASMLEELERQLAQRRRPLPVKLACILALLTAAGFLWCGYGRVSRVEVNFITDRFDATILLNGEFLYDSSGAPHRTPCTVPDVPARVQTVVLQHPDLPDLDLGRIDFAETREIVAKWSDHEVPGRNGDRP